MRYADQEACDRANMFGMGQPDDAFAQYFVGQSYLQGPNPPSDEVPVGRASVTFLPGCRNNWDRHDSTTGGG